LNDQSLSPAPAVVVTLLCLLGAFGAGALLTAGVRRWSRQWGFLDNPGGHKAHAAPVALGGGIAIMWAFLVIVAAGLLAMAVSDHVPGLTRLAAHKAGAYAKLPSLLIVLGSALILHVVGLIDDVRPLKPWQKLLAQVGVACLVVFGAHIRAAEVLGTIPSIVLTILWLVGISNSINLLDNADGLCAGVVAIAAAFLAVSASLDGQVFVPALAWVVAGASLGYLLFNFPPATIFMGDAGSLPLGFLLAVLTVLTTYYNPSLKTRPYGLAAPLFILAVPLYDTISVMIYRYRLGVPLFKGDRRHFSHRLMRKGMSSAAMVLTIYLATATTGMSALLLPRVNWFEAVLLFVQCLCVLSIVAILEGVGGYDKTAK
jgi:UDP-GlcNAc:undecaprenyl-phosphate/decaprenyl-phosphate GlcNAc-1-phosphate transferase